MAYLNVLNFILKNRVMVQMAPNKSTVSAIVLSMDTYAAQADFYLLDLEITSAKKSTEQLQMPGAQKGDQLKAIVSKSMADELKISAGSKLECELKKVSLYLWRAGSITLKPSAKQKKK